VAGVTTIVGIDPSLTSLGLARIAWREPAERPHQFADSGELVVPAPGWLAETWSRSTTGKARAAIADEDARITHLAADAAEFCLPCDLAVIEGPSMHSRGGKPWERAGLWWRIVHRLVANGVPVLQFAPTSRAKWATGSGKADKAAVSAAMARMWPDADIRNSDEGDALALASIGVQFHLGSAAPFPLPKYRVETLANALAKAVLPDDLQAAA
jgi:crossover junction endodeoxyribonuclease RuvC